ncbi:hypothetical protein A3770_18p81450 [Chloropicon primus]|uniref:Uncharacterized protein n=4 Tax=Chloropicon primus TaxID=1764295 RepID=A0A5B8MYI9_9CHLO|nr:hypothetical protein A3770_18p81450 [Chloropicon primus]|eukprot:QDZ25627.1 hypothetical protein A3770_18p81450 [Chloropicon primus]
MKYQVALLFVALFGCVAFQQAQAQCQGKWSGYGSCVKQADGTTKKCKTWVYTTQVAFGQFSSGGGSSGGGGGGGACNGLKDATAMFNGGWKDDKLKLGNTYVGCPNTMWDQPVMRRSLLGGSCPSYGTKKCVTTGCTQGCQGTWTSYGACQHNWATGKTEKCRLFIQSGYGGNGGGNNGGGGGGSWWQDRRSLLSGGCPSKECTSDGCVSQQTHCSGGWSGYGPCQYDSASKANKRCKSYTVYVQASGGGNGCPYANGAQSCAASLCPQPKDCVGHWGSYSECKFIPQGGMYQRCRRYLVTKNAAHNGQSCPYSSGKIQCTSIGCAQPANCQGHWTSYKACNNGKKCRNWVITTPASGGGSQCSHSHGQEDCTTYGCPQATNCQGQWSAYGSCSKHPVTHVNQRCRMYSITQHAANGGSQCGYSTGSVQCTVGGCSQPVDCKGAWSYSSCNYYSYLHKFMKVKSYQHIVSAQNGGQGCPYNNGYSVKVEGGCAQPVDCQGSWSAYGSCAPKNAQRRNLLGGAGVIETHKCRTYKITVNASNQGKACPFYNNQVDCTSNGCASIVDCEGGYSGWSDCSYDAASKTTRRSKTYQIYTPASNGGKTCPHASGLKVWSTGGCPQPVDCQYEYTTSECQIKNGVAKRCKVFNPTVLPSANGAPCPFSAGQEVECSTNGCAQPVDCVGHWEMGDCKYHASSKTNKRCKMYKVTQMNMNGGQACPVSHMATECMTEGCAQPVDCEWESVSDGQCKYDSATKQNLQCKTAKITKPAANNGEACPHADGYTKCTKEGCAQPQSCVGAWGAYTSCHANGSNNERCRVYSILSDAKAGGEACPHANGHKECTQGGCVQPVDCKFVWEDILPAAFDDDLGAFGEFPDGADALPEQVDDELKCHVDPVAGTSKKCKKVKVTVPATHNGKACPHPDGYEVCSEEECAQPVNCVGSFTGFGSCEYDSANHSYKKCRSYKVSVASANGGFLCPFANNHKECILGDCEQPKDCEFGWQPYMGEGAEMFDATEDSMNATFGACILDKETGANVRCKIAIHTVDASKNGKACEVENLDKVCMNDGCAQPVHCHGEWSEYSQCFHDTDEDSNKRCRTYSVKTPAAHGGEACKFEDGVKACTVAGCGQPIDCESEWTPYGSCQYHASSQSNKRCRGFNVTTVPDNNGEQCPYPMGYSQCVEAGCPQPVDCVGAWEEYEECYHNKEDHTNEKCRKYKVTTPAAHGGAQCPHVDGKTECTQGGCDQPKDCLFGWFSKKQVPGQPEQDDLGVSECALENGVSEKCSYVSILAEPSNHGYACPFPEGYPMCSTANCTQPVDCVGGWEQYNECMYVTGLHKSERCRQYKITTQAAHGGKSCPHVDGHNQCTKGGCPQPVDCKYELTNPTACELHVSDGGSSSSNRQCKTAKIVTEAKWGGLACPYTEGEKVCTSEGCEQPVDCVGAFLPGSCMYKNDEHVNWKCDIFEVTTPAKYGGQECPHVNGYKMCSKADCDQPVDCKYEFEFVKTAMVSEDGNMTEDSALWDCVFYPETLERKRCKVMHIVTEPQYNGKACPYPEGKELCDKTGCKQPKACVGEWSDYSKCYNEEFAGVNQRCRKYKITQPAVAGGPVCPFPDGFEQCSMGGCSQPIDCEGEWISEGTCEFNDASKSNEKCKTFSITTKPEYFGKECPYMNGHKECSKEGCDQPVHCHGEWSEYNQCFHDTDEDSNKRCRTYSVKTPAAHGGEACKFEDGVKACTVAGCGQPIDCESEWTPYGSCEYYASSQSNKRCKQFDITTVPDNNGEQCQHAQGYAECTEEGCAQPVDCVGAWEEYEECYYEQGAHENKRCRKYKVTTPAAHGGAQCPHVDGKSECTQGGCDQPVDCVGGWSMYTGTCQYNNETQLNTDCKTYEVTVEAAHNGLQCLFLDGELRCDAKPCKAPVACVGSWGNYDNCAYDEGSDSNKRCRKYTIETEAAFNGPQCPHADGEMECVAEGCPQPVDCVGAWQQYGECEFDANEHENKRCRFYEITQEALNGGVQCPHEDGLRSCNNTLCPQPQNCVGSFSDVGSCSYVTAEHSNKACKVFTVDVEAAFGGDACAHENNFEQCTSSVCDQPVDCVGDFVTAPNCTFDETAQEWQSCGTYRITTPAAHGGHVCAHSDGHKVCDVCQSGKVPVDCAFDWVEETTDECATGGEIKHCSVFTITQEPNAYGEACPHEAGHKICRTEECKNDDNGGGSNQHGSNGHHATGSGITGDDKETSTANTATGLMYGGIALAGLLCCCIPLCCYYQRKKKRQAALSQSVEGRKYSLLNYGNPNMVTMPVGANTTMMQNPFFGASNGARSGTLGGEVNFNSNPLGEEDYGDEDSGLTPSTEVSGRGSVNEGFFNPMFIQEQHEEVVGSLQQNMYAMYDYIDSMCDTEAESMAFGEIKKDMQEAMISWTQIEESLIDSEGQTLTQSVTSEDMEEKLKAIRQKLNKIEQSAFMCRDINTQEKSSLSNMINQARGKLRRVSTVGGNTVNPRRKTTMPSEWKQIRMKLKTVKALQGGNF